MNDFSTTIAVTQSAEQVFAAVLDVRGWWPGTIEGSTDLLGAEFSYDVPGVHHSQQRITQLDAPHRLTWLVLDSDLSYLQDRAEWTGTTMTFDVVENDGRTKVTFRHLGLVPEQECWDSCSPAWTSIVQGYLRRLIENGDAEMVPFAGAQPTR